MSKHSKYKRQKKSQQERQKKSQQELSKIFENPEADLENVSEIPIDVRQQLLEIVEEGMQAIVANPNVSFDIEEKFAKVITKYAIEKDLENQYEKNLVLYGKEQADAMLEQDKIKFDI